MNRRAASARFPSDRCRGIPGGHGILVGLSSAALLCGASQAQVALDEATDPTSAEHAAWVDADIDRWRIDLLRQAFDVATMIPVEPHLKDRSRTQGEVLDALIELGQPGLARELSARIENWRRSEVLAKMALHAAREGVDPEEVRTLIAASDAAHPADLTQWRHDRIDANLARAFARIGDLESAVRLEQGFGRAAQGTVVGETLDEMPREAADRLLARIDEVVALADLDQVLRSIEILLDLHARFYDDVALRSDLERRVDEAAVRGKVPHGDRVRQNLRLADEAVRRGDLGHARMLVGRARGVFQSIQDRTPFPPEFLLPMLGELAERRAAAGEVEEARAEIEAALETLESNRKYIIDIFRSTALRPVAVAAVATGEPALADRVFRTVIDVGTTNINSRPRAEDLARALVAMSVHGHRPSEALQARIVEVIDSMGDPW